MFVPSRRCKVLRAIPTLNTRETSMVSLGHWNLIERYPHLVVELLSCTCFAIFLGLLKCNLYDIFKLRTTYRTFIVFMFCYCEMLKLKKDEEGEVETEILIEPHIKNSKLYSQCFCGQSFLNHNMFEDITEIIGLLLFDPYWMRLWLTTLLQCISLNLAVDRFGGARTFSRSPFFRS